MIRDIYLKRLQRFEAKCRDLERRAGRVGTGRLLVFLTLGLSFFFSLEAPSGLLWAIDLAAAALFVWLVFYHRLLGRRLRSIEALAGVNRDAIAAVDRNWADLSEPPLNQCAESDGAAFDLDLTGPSSLFHLVGRVATVGGAGVLRDWLLCATAPEVIAERQEAVRELAPGLERRQRFLALGKLVPPLRLEEVEGFLEWTRETPWYSARPLLRWISYLLPGSIWLFTLLQVAGVVARPYWLLAVFVSLGVSLLYQGKLHAEFARASARAGSLQLYAEFLRLLEAESFESELLRSIRRNLSDEGLSAYAAMRSFRHLTAASDLRFGGMHPLVQILTFWDWHVLRRMELWKLGGGDRVESWFRAIGEYEALSAFAGLLHDNPEWCTPSVSCEVDRFRARGLGHPLIAEGRRVDNDVVIGPPGTFLLVTGSNMSGKSTLLRAVGLNVALAEAGGPCCATEVTMPPVLLQTSMRVTDSLDEGLSYFMAGLKQLKRVVTAAQSATANRRVLYLLDEILQGTNTAERSVAVRRIIARLVESGAIGAVTTHDLAIADAEEIRKAAVRVHFSEEVIEHDGVMEMHFDYRLKRGIAQSQNALKLMEMLGLNAGGSG